MTYVTHVMLVNMTCVTYVMLGDARIVGIRRIMVELYTQSSVPHELRLGVVGF